MVALRPPLPFAEEQKNEFGLGAYGDGARFETRPNTYVRASGGGTVWYTRQINKSFDFGVTLRGDSYPNFLGGGISLRPRLVDTDRVHVALDIQGGWFWGEVGLPIALRLVDHLYVYTAPAVGGAAVLNGWEPAQFFARLPVGIAWQVTKHWVLMVEGSAFWMPFDPETPVDPMSSCDFLCSEDPPRWFFAGSAAVAYRF